MMFYFDYKTKNEHSKNSYTIFPIGCMINPDADF